MIRIRKYKRDDARAAAALISSTYAVFNSHEGTQSAVRDYTRSYCPNGKSTEEIHQRLSRTPICFIAHDGVRVVGIVRGIENRLINLFVHGDFHRRGIATQLVRKFEKACLKKGFTEVVLHGSIYATPFYESVGYRKTTGIRNYQGLKVQPMKKKLNRHFSDERE